jgi:hypothetical protein
MFQRAIAIALLILASCTLYGTPGITPLIQFKPAQNIFVNDATSDAQGHVYLCGLVKRGAALPGNVVVRGGGGTNDFDAFAMKLRSNGAPLTTLVLSGNGYEVASRLTTDSHGNVVIYGTSGSTDFPAVNALFPTPVSAYSSFLCKVDSSLTNIIFSTFLNGTGTRAMAVDHEDNILLAGMAVGGPGLFPNIPAQTSDTFFLKLAPNGTNILYSTLLGANISAYVSALAIDSSGVAHAVGSSWTFDFPLVNALQPFKPGLEGYGNAFLVRIGTTGTILSSTFIGGNCYEEPTAVAVNDAGEIYVAGSGVSDVLPATAPAMFGTALCGNSKKGFLLKLGAGATNVLYSKTFALTENDFVSSVVVTPDGRAVVGGTLSASWAYQPGVPFLAPVADDGSATLLLPQDCGRAADFERMALHPSGRILITGYEDSGHDFNLGSFVVLADLARLEQKPQLRIISPKPFSVIGTNEPLQLLALATGFTEEIESVTFHEGKTLLGTATNAPYTLQVPTLTRGNHKFTAVVHTAQSRVSSCTVAVNARSPRNDHFTNRIQLTGQRVSVRGDMGGATIEPDERYYPESHSVWYSWRAPRDGAFEFSMSEDSVAQAAVMVGTSLPTLQTINYFYGQTAATLLCKRGETFHLRVASYYASPVPFKIQIRAVTTPANDNFENARTISGTSASVSGDFTHATQQAGELGYGDTLWYSWTAPASGLYLASTTNGAAYIEVYTGSVLTNLVARGQRVYGLITGSAFYADAGETYFVSASRADVTFHFTLSIEPHLPPTNDAFANRILIPAGTLSVTGSCIGATLETNEPSSPYDHATHSVWFKWIAPSSSVYRASALILYPPPTPSPIGSAPLVRPSTPESMLVYTGDALDNLTSVNNFQYPWDDEIWRAEAGVEYQIAISGGVASFALNISPVPKPPNDDFANATLLIEFQRVRGTTVGAGFEPLEPNYTGYYMPDSSVWYRWIAPSNGMFVVETFADVEVFTGDSLATLLTVDSSSYPRAFRATAGVPYSFAVVDSGDFTLRVRPASPPANDDFANRQILSGSNIDFIAHLRDSTLEPGESRGLVLSGHSVWYAWTAPTNGLVTLRRTNDFPLQITVYTGDALTNRTYVNSSYYSSSVDFDATAGTTYLFSLESVSVHFVNIFYMELRTVPPPVNDNFADRIILSGSSVSISGSNTAATAEANEPRHGEYFASSSVWYSWTAPQTGRASFAIDGDFYPIPAVYTGDELATLVRVSPSDNSGVRFNIPVQAGVTYQIAVDDIYSYFGYDTFTLDIHYALPPPNDDFANRLSLTNGRASGTIEAASREPNEPGYDTDVVLSSVWWTWTPSTNGFYRVQLLADQYFEYFDLRVYTGNQLSLLSHVSSYSPHYDSDFVIYANAGVPHALQVVGLGTDYATFELMVDYEPSPPNDHFANAIALLGENVVAFGSNTFATMEAGEPNENLLFTAANSVWWRWTAPTSATFRIEATNDSFRGLVRVFVGNSVSNLTRIPGTGYGSESFGILFRAEAGTTYHVSVRGYRVNGNQPLNGPITLNLSRARSPVNDDFANRTTLSGAHISVAASNFDATREPIDPVAGVIGEQTVWWRWTAPVSGPVTLNALSSIHFAFRGGVYLGNALSNLAEVASTNFLPLQFTATAGVEYATGVTTWSYYGIDFTLTLDLLEPSPLSSPPAARLEFRAAPNRPALVETSTNLFDWEPLQIINGTNLILTPRRDEPQRFFRVR